ncbi:hypothetical protein F5Y04DRAFT_257539 [Hypomontagnella monticulosa]|nr:hypothetical protein F5Y04DRAFT_257539 [Hypomontagnella monticulosa]
MERGNTPVPSNRDPDSIEQFIDELEVLRNAASIIDVPVNELVQLWMSRIQARNSRGGFYRSPIQQNVSSGLLPPSPDLDTPWPGDWDAANGGFFPGTSPPVSNIPSTNQGLASAPPMDPATAMSMPLLNLASQDMTTMSESYLIPPHCDVQDTLQPPMTLPQELCFPNFSPNTTNRVSEQGLTESGESLDRIPRYRDTFYDLDMNTFGTGPVHVPASSTHEPAPNNPNPLVLLENSGEFGLGNITSTWFITKPIQDSPSTPEGESSYTTGNSSPTPELPHAVKLQSSNPPPPITKLRDIRPKKARLTAPVLDIMRVKKPKRKSFEPRQRLETSRTRKDKACIRCHMQHVRCLRNPDDPNGDCLTCANLKGPTLSQLPCLRYKISDSQLLDKGAHPRFTWTKRWTNMNICEIEAWTSPVIKTITLTQDIGDASYTLKVREFFPLPGDSLIRTWNSPDGIKSHPCAPYAIANMGETSKTFVDFVTTHTKTFLKHYIGQEDVLLRRTYRMAYDHSRSSKINEERVLLDSVLRLWVGSRMESKQERVSSKEVLGMTPQDRFPDASNYGNYLVPPVMQAQIEILTTSMILLPMKHRVLKLLQNLVEQNLARSWFTVYLTMFILLHSCSMLTRAEEVRAAREGETHAQSRYFNQKIVEEFHSGARTMLAYFHYCNKGGHPFSKDWSHATDMSFAELNASQVQFIKETIELVKEKRAHFEHIKSQGLFEDDYYFISQLYELHWTPRHTV